MQISNTTYFILYEVKRSIKDKYGSACVSKDSLVSKDS